LVCFFIPNNNLFAGDLPENDVPLDALHIILKSPDFGGERDSWGIRLRNQTQEDTPTFNNERLLEFFERLREFFANSLFIVLISLIIALTVFLIIFFLKTRKNKKAKMRFAGNPALRILGQNSIKNPNLLLEKALNYHEQGNIRLSWGYCTSAAIWFLQIYRGLVFPPNATENDCAKIFSLKSENQKEVNAFNSLINHWVYLAYGGINPPAESFNEAIKFCTTICSATGENNG